MAQLHEGNGTSGRIHPVIPRINAQVREDGRREVAGT
jgi:hypothetical protein